MIAAAFEVDNNTLMLGILAALVVATGGLLAALAQIKTWIREVAGVKETASMDIAGQPIQVEMARQFTTRESFQKHAELNRMHHEKIELRVAALERKLESDKDQIIAAGEDRANELHRRIDAIPHQVIALLKDTKGLIG